MNGRARRRVGLLLLIFCPIYACASVRDPGTVVNVLGHNVFAVERAPVVEGDRPTVLFLHGASFDAEIWVRLGILDMVADEGFPTIAIDLPGHGRTEQLDVSPDEFLASLIDVVDRGSGVVVVSPSMSGRFSLPLIASRGAGAMAGFVAVAPVGVEAFSSSVRSPIRGLPSLLIWGEHDSVVNVTDASILQGVLVGSRLVVLEGAGHAAYEDRPEAFTEALVDFLKSVCRTPCSTLS